MAIVDCNAGPWADYMENYPVETDVQTGDIVIASTNTVLTKDNDHVSVLAKANIEYQNNIIGVVSDPAHATDFNSIGYNINDSDNPMPVGLNGRLKVKIAGYSQDIAPGDYITSSTEPGKGMKATRSGFVVGKALENWTAGSGKTEIMVFINPTLYIPDSVLSYLAAAAAASTPAVTPAGDAAVTPSPTTMPGNVTTAPTTNTFSSITTESLTAVNVHVTGLLTTAQLKTQVLAAYDSKSIIVKLSESLGATSFTIQNAQGIEVFAVNSKGDVKADNVSANGINLNTDKDNAVLGSDVLLSGQTEIKVSSKSITANSKVFLTPTTETDIPLFVDKTEDGDFVVKIKEIRSFDISFNWFIFN